MEATNGQNFARRAFEEAITRILTEGTSEIARILVMQSIDPTAIDAASVSAGQDQDQGRIWLLENLSQRVQEMMRSGQGEAIESVRAAVVGRIMNPALQDFGTSPGA
ncbi:MAG: hypothetical protein ACD_65C00326G0003 [uncultured bacterium]|nr:MAG: hypothetical protein ACD_65C00326G0003 [uncultured bacterium]KKT01948.1 MAG: hypothetical protein UV80_C0007G0062 [Candidatus Peregrinibacteria bacterium GW2011_GWF2_43_17]HAU39604.1 hypothetical protein [Candidatus Peregrinibacteria bacterium]